MTNDPSPIVIRKEQKQTPIPSPVRSPRNISFSDKTISKELTDNVSPKLLQHPRLPSQQNTRKDLSLLKQEIYHEVLLAWAIDKDREVSPVDISDKVSKEFAAHGPKMIEELFRQHMQNITLNLYPKTSSSTAMKSSADLQQQLYLNIKAKP
ncbi:hypothetical protein Tco_0238066 [Tanacetum coccineum]